MRHVWTRPRELGIHVRRNIVAYLALFFALGGTAIAAKPMLTGADVQDGTLNSADLRNRDSTAYPGPSIQGQDVEANALTGAEIDESTLTGVPATGGAGGDLTGNYPNPTIGTGKVTPGKTDLLDGALLQNEEVTSATGCNDLATSGPSVTVDAPEKLVAVFVEVEGKAFVENAGGGTADHGGWRVCMQVGDEPPVEILRMNPCRGCAPDVSAFSTLQTAPGSLGVEPGLGGWLVYPVSGVDTRQTVTLKYGCIGVFLGMSSIPCDHGHTATFRNRRLWVMGVG